MTSVQLVKFFTKLAYHRTKGLNFICDFLYDEAILLATKHDNELPSLLKSGKKLPLLFGVPISIKDVFEFTGSHSLTYQGHDTTLGSA